MSEYSVVQHATFSPTHCFFCLDYAGPFIDTNVEDPRFGHIYICGPTERRPGCVGQMAHLFGMETISEREQKTQELTEKVAEMESERKVTITYDDLMKALKAPRRVKRTLPTE